MDHQRQREPTRPPVADSDCFVQLWGGLNGTQRLAISGGIVMN